MVVALLRSQLLVTASQVHRKILACFSMIIAAVRLLEINASFITALV